MSPKLTLARAEYAPAEQPLAAEAGGVKDENADEVSDQRKKLPAAKAPA